MTQDAPPPLMARAFSQVTNWMHRCGPKALRIAVGLVYLWFGALKFSPDTPALDSYLPGATVHALTFGLLDSAASVRVLAVWECFIGFCLMTAVLVRPALLLLLGHLFIMFLPAIFWPGQVWNIFPYGLTLRGQYIVKNLVFIGSALVLAARLERPPAAAVSGRLRKSLRTMGDRFARLVRRRGLFALRIGLGVVYLWFGALKFFPGISPAEELAARTVEKITFGLMPPPIGLPVLATWECLIGVGLLGGLWPRGILTLICFHLLGTFTPLFFFPNEVWSRFPFGLTLVGKYIVRNVVLYGAALMIGADLAARERRTRRVESGQVPANVEAAPD